MISYELVVQSHNNIPDHKVQGTYEYEIRTIVKDNGIIKYDFILNVKANEFNIFPDIDCLHENVDDDIIRRTLIQNAKDIVNDYNSKNSIVL